MKNARHHGFTHSTVHHHKDGSHTMHHHHEEGPEKDVEHAAADHDGMMESMQNNLAPPEPQEEAAGAPGMPGGAPPAA